VITLADILEAAAYIEHADRARLGGPPPRTHCKRGHDLAVFGQQKWVTNVHGVRVKSGRECRECKRQRQRNPASAPRPAAQKPRATTPDPRTSTDRALTP
jgi:hypothetical protein